MLKFIEGNDNQDITVYECPVSLHDTWSDALKSINKNSKFYINPEKFAKAYEYNLNDVTEALDRYIEYGSGKFQKPQTIDRIISSALSFCQSPNNSKLRHARVNSNRAITIENKYLDRKPRPQCAIYSTNVGSCLPH